VEGGEWFGQVREFLAESDCALLVKNVITVKLRRERDQAIMVEAMRMGFRGRELMQINKFGLFLQVECKSDICNAKGDRILDQIDKRRNETMSESTKLWPVQPRPCNRKWREFIRSIANDDGKLRAPLGPWHYDCWDTRRFRSSYNPVTKAIKIKSNGEWREYARGDYKIRRHRYEMIGNGKITDQAPTDGIPVDEEEGTVVIPFYHR
jgi:hypothetical protein